MFISYGVDGAVEPALHQARPCNHKPLFAIESYVRQAEKGWSRNP
jgi:hypothetical protein